MVISIFGNYDQKAMAFEATPEELEVIQRIAELKLQLDELTYDDSNYWDVLYQYFTALRALNDLGLFLEDQNPNLDHLTAQYNSTRAAAQAGLNATEHIGGQGAPCYRCGVTIDDDEEEDEKTIYVIAAHKQPYLFWGIEIFDHSSSTESRYVQTGQNANIILKSKWSGTESNITPYCQVGASSFPTEADYTIGLLVRTLTETDLQNTVDTELVVFQWYNPVEQYEGKEINNLAKGIQVYCSLTGVTLE